MFFFVKTSHQYTTSSTFIFSFKWIGSLWHCLSPKWQHCKLTYNTARYRQNVVTRYVFTIEWQLELQPITATSICIKKNKQIAILQRFTKLLRTKASPKASFQDRGPVSRNYSYGYNVLKSKTVTNKLENSAKAFWGRGDRIKRKILNTLWPLKIARTWLH